MRVKIWTWTDDDGFTYLLMVSEYGTWELYQVAEWTEDPEPKPAALDLLSYGFDDPPIPKRGARQEVMF